MHRISYFNAPLWGPVPIEKAIPARLKDGAANLGDYPGNLAKHRGNLEGYPEKSPPEAVIAPATPVVTIPSQSIT